MRALVDLPRLRRSRRPRQAPGPRRPRRDRRRRRARSLGAGRAGRSSSRPPGATTAASGPCRCPSAAARCRRRIPFWHGGTRARPAHRLPPGAGADRGGAVEQRRRRPRPRGAAAPASRTCCCTRESLPVSANGTLAALRRNRALAGAAGVIVGQRARRPPGAPRPPVPAPPHHPAARRRRSRSTRRTRRPTPGLSIGFVGRLIPEKGLDLLFRAAVKLVGRWTITVVGHRARAGGARGAGRAAGHRGPGHLARARCPGRRWTRSGPGSTVVVVPSRDYARAGSRSPRALRSTPWPTASPSSAAPPAPCPRPSAMPGSWSPRRTSPR